MSLGPDEPDVIDSLAMHEDEDREYSERDLLEEILESIDLLGAFLERIAMALESGITITEATPPRPAATHAVLVITPTKGTDMPGTITVDTTNETVTLDFKDKDGDLTTAPVAASGSALVVTFTSDNTAAATVALDPANALQGDITSVAVGVANIGATFAYADGSAVFEADGVTPFPDPAPAAVTVTAGAATSSGLALSV